MALPRIALVSIGLLLVTPAFGQTCALVSTDAVGSELREHLRSVASPQIHLSYAAARDSLYANVDGATGLIEGLYTGATVPLLEGDPSQVLFEQGINAEHVWPQSMGAREWPQRADLHNVFPTVASVNNARGNKPFAELDDETAPSRYGAEELSFADKTSWEPRLSKKGDVARAALYFFTMWEVESDVEFLREQLPDLVAWHEADPPDGKEKSRTMGIARLQGNCNPFVSQPELLRLAFQDYLR